MTFNALTETANYHFTRLRTGGWKIYLQEFFYGFIGLFVLDVSWRIMDLMIDFVCDHIHWMKFLSDN